MTDTEFLTPRQAAELLHVSPRTLLRWRKEGGGPPYTRAGATLILYSRDAIMAWAGSRTYRHTADEQSRQEGAA